MNILAIDAASSNLIVALKSSKGIIEYSLSIGMAHQETLLTVIDDACKLSEIGPKDLEKVVCGHGPGSFTGIRVGLAAAKAIAVARGINLVLVSGIDAIGEVYKHLAKTIVCMDAKKDRLYVREFEFGKPLGEIGDIDYRSCVSRLEASTQATAIFGPETDKFQSFLAENAKQIPPYILVDSWARGLINVGQGITENHLNGLPLYVRESDADLGVFVRGDKR